MRIAIITDTHWGFSFLGNSKNIYLLNEIRNSNTDLLLHCGDYSTKNYLERLEYWRLCREILGSKIKIGTVNGNHDYWEYSSPTSIMEKLELPQYSRPNSPIDILSQNSKIFRENNIYHLLDGIHMEYDTIKLAIYGFDGWYEDNIHTNDNRYIPHYGFPDGKYWLQKKSFQEMEKCISNLTEDKRKGYTTILVSHFGFISEAKESDPKVKKSGEYFGAPTTWEVFLDPVDYFFFGHSHSEFFGTAKNGHTKCINVGSDYENPKVYFLDM